jgi:hypothetical protein
MSKQEKMNRIAKRNLDVKQEKKERKEMKSDD